MIDSLVSALEERRWKTDILSLDDGQIYISGGSMQGLQIGDVLALMSAGQKVKSKQSGFDIELPAKRIATIKITGFFGESENSEGSVCELIEGNISNIDIDKIYVEEIAK